MNHDCWSFGKEMAGSREWFFSRTGNKQAATVKVTALNRLCNLVGHQERGQPIASKKGSLYFLKSY